MSTIIMTACWPLQGMNASQKAVLISLADNANDDGVCWPSIKYISERTCLSERAVQSAIKFLQEVGLLVVTDRNGRSNVYTIQPENYIDPRKSSTPAESAPPQKSSKPPQNLHPSPANPAGAPADPAPRTINNRNRTTNEPSLDFSSWPEKPSKRVWADYQKLRKQKKAPITQTVVTALGKEMHEAAELGFSVDDFLTECVLRGWQGGKAEWLRRDVEGRRESPKHNNFAKQDYNAGVDEHGYF